MTWMRMGVIAGCPAQLEVGHAGGHRRPADAAHERRQFEGCSEQGGEDDTTKLTTQLPARVLLRSWKLYSDTQAHTIGRQRQGPCYAQERGNPDHCQHPGTPSWRDQP